MPQNGLRTRRSAGKFRLTTTFSANLFCIQLFLTEASGIKAVALKVRSNSNIAQMFTIRIEKRMAATGGLPQIQVR